MIVSRPQTTNLLSFILFLVIAGTLITINILSILRDPQPPWFNYLIVGALTPIAAFILYKVLFRYKIIRMGNGQVTIDHPQFRRHREYALKDVAQWGESVIKTGKNSTFRELEIRFTDGQSITMAYQEYTSYNEMIGYLGKKIPKVKLTKAES